MDPVEIKEIETLIPLEEDEKVVSYSTTRLTAPGENYGSLMLRLVVVVEDLDGKQEEIDAVAKMVPPNEFLQEVFNTQTTFRNEIAFYKDIVPILQNFQRECGVKEVIDFAPKFFGGRINLNGSSTVDSDAILVLENLNTSGYRTFERTEGFELDAAELIIKDMAHFHGVPLALKLQRPEVFEKEVKPYILAELKPPREGPEMGKMEETISSTDGCKPFVARAMKAFKNMTMLPPREPFATINHNDIWVNNTMIKVDRRGRPIQNKLVDFQVCTYGSPARDLIFFLFSSVKNHVLERHYDHLVNLYHKTLISVLEELKCDTSPFSFKAFGRELEVESEGQFAHTIFMTYPMFAKRGTVKDISEFKPENMMENGPTKLQREKIAFVIKQFVKRNWI